MTFTAEKHCDPAFDFNEPVIQVVEDATYAGDEQPTAANFQTFTLEQPTISIEGGNQSLRLVKPLTLQMNFETMRFKVIDWGIEMDYLDLPRLPREIARRFLILFNNANNESFTEKDQADWLHIIDYIDFTQFSIDRSVPRYMTGTLLSRGDHTFVEWHDGSHEKLHSNVASALNEVNVKEQFSAFVKLGRNNIVSAIERVSILQPPNGEEDWESWPKKI